MSSKRKVVRLHITHSDEIRKAKNKIIEISNMIMKASGLKNVLNFEQNCWKSYILKKNQAVKKHSQN